MSPGGMLGHRRRRLQEISFAIDGVAGLLLLAAVFAFLLLFTDRWQALLQAVTGYPFRVNRVDHLVDNGWVLLLPHFCMLLALRLTGYYEHVPVTGRRHLMAASARGVALGTAATALLLFLLGISDVNRSLIFLYGIAFAAYQSPKEVLLRRWWQARPGSSHNALLVCNAREAAERLERPSPGLRIRGVRLEDGAALPAEHAGLHVPSGDSFGDLLLHGRFDVVLLGRSASDATAQAVLAAAEEQGVDVWQLTRFPIPAMATVVADELAGQPVLVFKTASRYESRFAIKRTIDIAVSLVLLALLSPLLLGIALVVKVTSPGPVLFRQDRTGWRGRTFRILKFRSMYADAERRHAELASHNKLNGPVFKVGDDPRVTPLGRWLRRYSLDELPQFINVLRGDMSLVGPRPLPVYETSKFPCLRDYRRLSVLPGITGLWQVSGRADIIDFEEWVRLDLQYIDRWSLGLDAKILLKTLPAVLRASGAH